MSVINDDSLFCRANTRKMLINLRVIRGLGRGAALGILGCTRALTNDATGLAKAMGEALQQSCRAALGNLIGTPSSSSRLILKRNL